MKRLFKFVLFGLIAVLLVITFMSCSGGEKPPEEIITEFTAQIKVSMDESEISCEFRNDNSGNSTVTLSEPKLIEGMAFKWISGKYAIEYNGLFCETEKLFLAEDSFANILVGVLQYANDMQTLNYESTRDGLSTFSADTKWGKALITAKSDGYLHEITIEDMNFCAMFQSIDLL